MKVYQTDVFSNWVDGLKDEQVRSRVLVRVERLTLGNPGDVKPVGKGVSELRIHYGQGYRVYYKQEGKVFVILLAGGNKKTQPQDIKNAIDLAENLEEPIS